MQKIVPVNPMSLITYQDVPLFVAGTEKKRGIIVIQEWWGLTKHMKNMTQRLSKNLDCIALCPDLYRGKVGETKDEASHLMDHLDWPRAVTDVAAAVAYLKSQGVEKIGVVGFCMGGTPL